MEKDFILCFGKVVEITIWPFTVSSRETVTPLLWNKGPRPANGSVYFLYNPYKVQRWVLKSPQQPASSPQCSGRWQLKTVWNPTKLASVTSLSPVDLNQVGVGLNIANSGRREPDPGCHSQPSYLQSIIEGLPWSIVKVNEFFSIICLSKVNRSSMFTT